MTDISESGIEAAVKAHNTRQDPTLYGMTVQDYGLQQLSAIETALIPTKPEAKEDGIERLRAALKPFADFIGDDTRLPDDMPLTQGSAMAKRQVTVADFRRARSALQSKKKLRWTANLRWAMNAMRVRRVRHELTFSQRIAFDAELRPYVGSSRIAYPDAFYHITVGDIIRALRAAHGLPT